MEHNKEIVEEVDDINIIKEPNEKPSNNEEQQVNTKEEIKDNNFNVVSTCIKEERKVTSNEDVIETVPFPSTDSNTYIEYRNDLSTILNKIKSGEIDKSGYNVLLHTVNNVAGSKPIINNELVPEHTDDMVNDVRYSDKILNTTGVHFKQKDKMSKSASIAIFNAILNVGEVVQVPLWHSGFWVTLRPIKERDIINLNIILKNNVVEMGRYSNTLVYTNYNVMYAKIITDFIRENIVDYSINIDSTDDIRSYIKIEDLNILINGLVSSMYPNGYDISRACQNSLIFTDPNTKETKCDYTSVVRIDPKKLLWVNKKLLTDKMLIQMSKKSSKSVSVDEVKEYQRLLYGNKSVNTLEIETENKDKIYIELQSPDILSHCNKGEEWIDLLVEENDKNLIANKDTNIKNQRLLDLVYASKVGLYRSFIKSIRVNDNIVSEDQDTIDNFIDIMSASQDIVTKLFDHMTQYKNNTTIALIATPAYTCPNCKHYNNATDPVIDFEQLVPLDIISVFFDLCDIRQEKHR